MAGYRIDRRGALGLALAGTGVAALPRWAAAQPGIEGEVDAIVRRFMAAFETPGIGIAIVRPGQPPLLRGYGVRTLGRAGAVDAHTRFGIASNTKSFVAASIAMLVEEGKLGWDDPVRRHLPDFRMKDPHATELLTVRELLVHNSGLALGAGDLMQFPGSDRPPADAMKALPYLPFARGFRTGYAYDNILYVVAGLLIERVSGVSWAEFLTTRLLRPLGMADAVTAPRLLKDPNVVGRHARLGPPVRGLGRLETIPPDEGPMVDAPGGITASVADIAKWLGVQLAQGALPDGKRLWSAASAKEMWTPRTLVASGPGFAPDAPFRSVTRSYALGWYVQDYRGERLVSHSGGLSGQVTQTAMLPERGIGVAVFSNVEDGVSVPIRNALLDRLVGAPEFDWLGWYRARTEVQRRDALASAAGGAAAPAGGPSLPLAAYAGRYRDPWYGDVVVAQRGGRLTIDFVPTPVFKSALEPWGPDAFRTRFPRGAGEDAVISFAVAGGKATGMTMKALSPLADFSYDFHDLAFTRVE